eukprot:CAMPEP_0198295670 /NCGR_PEP_ID=MMETSP1449-20131203/29001_1 /TAXON_ID=420275 /ORGANISM="Attheya septentrionalis, Strain CCMP2084" /LENGTH=319 /DNA_ID=CAMNT_0043996053 /DNA_START=54 /DNA_END=1013 /DNA_ORIENTATION=-
MMKHGFLFRGNMTAAVAATRIVSQGLNHRRPLLLRRYLQSTSNNAASDDDRRQAMREIRQAKKEAMAEKERQLNQLLNPSRQSVPEVKDVDVREAPPTKESKKSRRIYKDQRKELYSEAGRLTKSLYRTCLRSVEMIRAGNEVDEANFKEREEDDDAFSTANMFSGAGGMVDRHNELESRANYYHQYTQENFSQESDSLMVMDGAIEQGNPPWREEQVHRVGKLLREGERHRTWILKEYHFDDAYRQTQDNVFLPRIERWEEAAQSLVSQTYRQSGWMPSHDRDSSPHEDEDEEDWFDDDDDDDDDQDNEEMNRSQIKP